MEPSADIVLAAEQARLALEASPVWGPSLTGSQVQRPAASVRGLLRDADSYFIVHIARGNDITARFALNREGILLEAEGAREASGKLAQWWVPPSDGAAAPPPLVWKPCDQSMTRLRPFYGVTGSNARFVRTDGAEFHALTTPAGRG